jgi:Flagellar hook-length control protein FliK
MNVSPKDREVANEPANERRERILLKMKICSRDMPFRHGGSQIPDKNSDVSWGLASFPVPGCRSGNPGSESRGDDAIIEENLKPGELNCELAFLTLTDEIASRLAQFYHESRSTTGGNEGCINSDKRQEKLNFEELVCDYWELNSLDGGIPERTIPSAPKLYQSECIDETGNADYSLPSAFTEKVQSLKQFLGIMTSASSHQEIVTSSTQMNYWLFDERLNFFGGTKANDNRSLNCNSEQHQLFSSGVESSKAAPSRLSGTQAADGLTEDTSKSANFALASQAHTVRPHDNLLTPPIYQVTGGIVQELKNVMPLHNETQGEHARMRSFRIRLSPEQLGHVDISFRIRGNSISLKFVADRSATVELLDKGQQELVDMIASLGFESQSITWVTKLEVNPNLVSKGDFGDVHQQQSKHSDSPMMPNFYNNSHSSKDERPRKDHEEEVSFFAKGSRNNEEKVAATRNGRDRFV